MQIKNRAKESLYKFICDKVCINIKQSVQQTYKHCDCCTELNSNLLCANSTFSDECCDEGQV